MTRTASERLAEIKSLRSFQALPPAEQHNRLVEEARYVLKLRQSEHRGMQSFADAAERRGDPDAAAAQASVPYCAGLVLEAQTVLDTLLGDDTPKIDQDRLDIEAALQRCGMTPFGDYDPARHLPDGRWSVSADTLLLLLTTFERANTPKGD